MPPSTTPRRDPNDQPFWRRQFPIDVADESKTNRREFVAVAAASAGVMCCGQMALEAVTEQPSGSVEDNSLPKLKLPKKIDDLQLGDAFVFHYPDHRTPCLLMRFDDTVYAFEQKCTHLACPVIPSEDHQQLKCPCHRGAFDSRTGQPLAGPPERPLRRVRIEQMDDGTLVAVGYDTMGADAV
ncbi:MAG: hypothetical protein Fues2KO_41500 [Fuerstiella sp.]